MHRKIKKLYVTQALVSRDYKNCFESHTYSLEYDALLQGYFIDKTLFVHVHNVREVVFEEEVTSQEYARLEEVTREVPVKKTWSRKKKVAV